MCSGAAVDVVLGCIVMADAGRLRLIGNENPYAVSDIGVQCRDDKCPQQRLCVSAPTAAETRTLVITHLGHGCVTKSSDRLQRGLWSSGQSTQRLWAHL